jgi:hypothetical protein
VPLPASRRVCGFAFTPAPGYCLVLSFSDSIRSARCMGSACSPTVQPAVPASTVALRQMEALRANSRRTALWLPCQPRRPWTLGSTSPAAKLTPGYLPGNSCCAFLVTAAPTVCLPFRDSRHRLLPGSQDFPRPKAHSCRPRCIGLPECTQLRLLKGRVHTLMRVKEVSGVRFPLVLIACHRDKPSPIVWISRCPRTLSVARCGLDLIQKKAASVCGLDSYCEMPIAG